VKQSENNTFHLKSRLTAADPGVKGGGCPPPLAKIRKERKEERKKRRKKRK